MKEKGKHRVAHYWKPNNEMEKLQEWLEDKDWEPMPIDLIGALFLITFKKYKSNSIEVKIRSDGVKTQQGISISKKLMTIWQTMINYSPKKNGKLCGVDNYGPKSPFFFG